jgi:hypothetical protein
MMPLIGHFLGRKREISETMRGGHEGWGERGKGEEVRKGEG